MKTKLDLSYLKRMSGGDSKTIQQLLKVLYKEIQQDLPKARVLYQKQDWKTLERFCHHFKSTISFSGDKQLINANLQLWDIAKQEGKSRHDAKTAIVTMERQGKMVAQEVAKILRGG